MDTSAFISLDRDYSRDVFPSLWENYILDLVNEGRMFATEEVKEELKMKDDDLYKWLSTNCSNIYIKTNLTIMTRVKEIMKKFPNLINPDNPTHNQADPFVIALALEAANILPGIKPADDVMVVTYENFTGDLKGPKMPDICKQYQLKVGKLIEIFKSEGWKIGG
jgi:hypothetical protein